MKNTQKGITLIALIITIIVLLILAVVAIGAVQNDEIINHAKNAKAQYGAAQVNENSTIQSYLDKIQEHVGTGSGVGTGTGENTEEGSNEGGSDENDEEGVNTEITFTCNGWTLKAFSGMTWEEWILSDIFKEYGYNDYEFWISENGNACRSDFTLTYEDGTDVKGVDQIRDGYSYR